MFLSGEIYPTVRKYFTKSSRFVVVAKFGKLKKLQTIK